MNKKQVEINEGASFKMNGGMKRLFQLTDERTKFSSAIQELIDNSIDANADDVLIQISDTGVQFKYWDNGCGMNSDKVEGFAREFSVNDSDAFERSEDSIGCFGVGFKDTLIKLSDHSSPAGAKAVMCTWPSPEDVSRVTFTISDNDEYAFLNPDVVPLRATSTQCKGMISEHGEHATGIQIDKIKSEVFAADGSFVAFSELISQTSRAYSFLGSIRNFNVRFEVLKGGKVKLSEKLPFSKDEMHLKTLYENNVMDEPGVYKYGNDFFVVRKYTLGYGDKRKVVKVIFLYTDDIDHGGSAMYAMYSNRYITWPEGANRQMPFNTTNRGGQGRMRFVVFVDDKNRDILHLRSNKSSGIDITDTNVDLAKWHVVGVREKKLTLTKAIENDFDSLYNMQIFKTKEQKSLIASNHTNGTAYEREATVDIAKRFMKGEGLLTLLREYDTKNGISSSFNTTGKPSVRANKSTKRRIPELAVDTVTSEDDASTLREAEIAKLEKEAEKAMVESKDMKEKPVIIFIKGDNGVREYTVDSDAIPSTVNVHVVEKISEVLHSYVEKGKLTRKVMGDIVTKFTHALDESVAPTVTE